MYKCRHGGMCDYKERGSICSFEGQCGAKEKTPEAKDLVGVVRCKDCKHRFEALCVMENPSTEDNDYCSYGEVRNED